MKTNEIKHIDSFLSQCAGAYIPVLKKCPTQKSKFVAMGTILFITAIMASISGGFFLFNIFKDIWTSVFFGIFWGTAIFSLDRYMIISYNPLKGGWERFLGILPRILLAVCLGLVIAKPLEIRIFQKEIQEQLITDNTTSIDAKISKHPEINNVKDKLLLLNTEIKELNQKLLKVQGERDSAKVDYHREIKGISSLTTTGKAGKGPEAKRKLAIWESKQSEYNNLASNNQSRILEINQAKEELYGQEKNIRNSLSQTVNNNDGFLKSLQALHNLSKDKSRLGWASLLLSLIFILFETAPILAKVILGVGSYERLIKEFEQGSDKYTKEELDLENYKKSIEIKRAKSQYNGDVSQKEQLKNKKRKLDLNFEMNILEQQYSNKTKKMNDDDFVEKNYNRVIREKINGKDSSEFVI